MFKAALTVAALIAAASPALAGSVQIIGFHSHIIPHVPAPQPKLASPGLQSPGAQPRGSAPTSYACPNSSTRRP